MHRPGDGSFDRLAPWGVLQARCCQPQRPHAIRDDPVGLIVVVYFFTPAAIGVANETLVNRMPLHLVPAAAFYALVLVLEGRGRPGFQPNLQATNAADA